LQIRRSLWITFAFSNASTIALFGVSLLLARILTPKEIGVFSLCVVIVNVVCVFRDLGVSPYLIRKGQVSAEDVGAVLGLTVTMSWVLALAIWLCRHRAAAYFGEPDVAAVLPILLIGFLLVPFTSVMSALLVRNLSAGRNAFVSAVSTVVYVSVVLGLAVAGFGAATLAWANAANLTTNLICFLIVMPKGFTLMPRWSGWRPIIAFSSGVVVTNLINAAHAAFPDAVIGRSLGAHDVGLYSRANGTVGLFNQAVGPTLAYNALPIIASSHREGPAALVEMIKRSTEMLTVLAWPVYAWIAVYAGEIIGSLYGPTWTAAAALVPWLCLAAVARTPFLMAGPALQAVNRPYAAAVASAANLGLRVLVLGVLGVSDLHRFAVALCLTDVLAMAAWAWVSQRHLGLSARALLTSQWRSLAVAGICLAVLLAAKWPLGSAGWPVPLVAALSGLLLAASWIAAVLITGHAFSEELRKGLRKFSATARA
jgi:O-antigen/teichoic acid export membrane protein